MTTEKKVARRKLSLLELAQKLGNVSGACKAMGYSRRQFYEIQWTYQSYGADGLMGCLPGAKSPHSNRVPEAVETAILAHANAGSVQFLSHIPSGDGSALGLLFRV